MGRHAFNPLPPRVAIYEIISGFVAATAVGLAAQFNGDKTVPGWLLIALLIGGPLLWAGAVAWLACAHYRQALIADGRPVNQGPTNVEAPVWRRLGVTATLAVTVATVVAVALAVRPDPNFSSPYDGADPNAAGCVDNAVTTPVGKDGPPITDLTGRQVGHLELKASPKCGTAWAKIVLDASVAPGLKGMQVMLAVYRPADDVREEYPLRLQGGTEGFSNMVNVIGTCVQAEAHLVKGRNNGPVARTRCVANAW